MDERIDPYMPFNLDDWNQYLSLATKWEQFVYPPSSDSVITGKKMAFVIDSLVTKKIILLKNNTAVKSGYLF